MQPFSHLQTLIEMCGITQRYISKSMDSQRGTSSVVTRSDTSRVFSGGSIKSMVYDTPVTSEEDLIARVHGTIESLTRQPQLLGRV